MPRFVKCLLGCHLFLCVRPYFLCSPDYSREEELNVLKMGNEMGNECSSNPTRVFVTSYYYHDYAGRAQNAMICGLTRLTLLPLINKRKIKLVQKICKLSSYKML